MDDENAFGLLISWVDLETEEYALERAEFVERWQKFRATWREALGIFALGSDVRALDLGHALYLEVAEGDQTEDPIAWIKLVRARLTEQGFATVGVVTHGGRWLSDEAGTELPEQNGVFVAVASCPSEPLRRALYADTAAHRDEADAPDGWGAGLYVDTEAIEALGRSLKNAPTPLAVAGATYFRVGA
ncbi:MAG: hypothetical protein IPI67_07310 [Myxococcales bacterium]|nr:hypothetical protein [Myxococcales bacterium]